MTQNHGGDRSTDGMVDYNENFSSQKQNIALNSDIISELAARVAQLPGDLNITDYGCGPGQSTIEVVRAALKAWQPSPHGRSSLSVCHADQPGNDWTALIKLIFGADGYATGPDAPMVMTSVGSFFKQMTPAS